MIRQGCLGPDVDPSRIAPDAEVGGAAWLTGRRTEVKPGAVVRDSRLHDAVIGEGAVVSDSVVAAEGRPRSHRCDAAGLTVVSGAELPTIAARACVTGSTLINTSVGRQSRVKDSWAHDCKLGTDNVVTEAKLVLTNSAGHVTITGPTEISEAYLGHHTAIDRRGYFEGIFSNTFRRLQFDAASGRLRVVGAIELPHVSRYGVNTINSTNSGKLLPQPHGVLKGFGPAAALWHDPLLSHEQVELGPCCWVAPWTKVVGQSADPHETDEALVNDPLSTYVMPFALAGMQGPSTQGLVMPGELSFGFGPKQRRGGWVFTYAPGAVMAMVRRLREALEADRKRVADTIVIEAVRAAIEITKAMAARHSVDLSIPFDRQRRGWPLWTAATHASLSAHLESGMWEFADGEPVGWRMASGRWTHPGMKRILALAPDALEKQVDEEAIFAYDKPMPPVRVAMPSGAAGGREAEAEIAPGAQVAADATIAPGCRIGPGAVIESGAVVWQSEIENSRIGARARIERSRLSGSTIGDSATVRSCRVLDSLLGLGTAAESSKITKTRLAPKSTVSAFADLEDVTCDFASILGGVFHSADIQVHLMSMHLAGGCRHLRAVPMFVEAGGKRVAVPAIPMLGGGSLIRGTKEQPVEMSCCFIASNATVEQNTYVGFGSFVLGTLGPDAGIVPFTLSTGPDARHQQIGGVLAAMPSTIITHFIGWTYQAVGREGAPTVAPMVRQAIQEGIRAIEWERARRSGQITRRAPQPGRDVEPGGDVARYRSLSSYSEDQLQEGLGAYRRAVESGAWDLLLAEGELRFASLKGRWLEKGGSAFWEEKA